MSAWKIEPAQGETASPSHTRREGKVLDVVLLILYPIVFTIYLRAGFRAHAAWDIFVGVVFLILWLMRLKALLQKRV
jgi:hypothetical protein